MQQQLRPLMMVNNTSLIAQASAGKQAYHQPLTLYYPPDVQSMCNTALTQEFAGATPTGYKTFDIFLKSASATVALTNSENANTRVIIYDVVYRKDITNDSSGGSGFTNTLITDGINNVGGSGTGYQVIGTTPFDAPAFTEYCKVIKTSNIVLAPGQTHYHRVNYQPNRRMNSEHIRAQSNGLIALGGLTYATLIQHYGSPVKDSAGTGVTTSATNLLTVVSTEYKYSYLPNDMSVISITNNLSGTQNANLENVVTGGSTAFGQV